MKDNFDLYSWNKNRYLTKKSKPTDTKEKDFDLREWNKKRYLGELDINTAGGETNVDNIDVTHGGDDPKIGAEEESDANVVGENKDYLESLALNLTQAHPDLEFEVSNFDDVRVYGSQGDLMKFGNKMHGEKFGEYEVFHVEDDDRGEIVRIVKSDSILRNKLEEASYMYKGYKDKHFDICPGAETLRDKLLAGEFKDNKWATGTNFEKEVGEWLYQHDVIFGIEKKIIKDKEGDESDIAKAKEAEGRVVNLSRDLGIPASEINAYLPAHIKTIKDMVEYSSLTESIKETLRFIKEHNPDFTNEEIKSELEEIKELGSQLNEKLCKKGEAYRKRRMAAGEKSSAYLSGRAVKVCKGQMSGKKKKK